jgi:hypothetical protein
MEGERQAGADERRDEPAITGPARVRDEDLEPHEGLRYIAKLFKTLAVLLLVMLIAEIVIGVRQDGAAALATLLIQATRILVFAGLLWGAGDLAVILIESNHDLRATRILVGRMTYRLQRLLEVEAAAHESHAREFSPEEHGPPPDVPPQVP